MPEIRVHGRMVREPGVLLVKVLRSAVRTHARHIVPARRGRVAKAVADSGEGADELWMRLRVLPRIRVRA